MASPQPDWRIYAHNLIPLAFGLPFWQPAPLSNYDRVWIGDVGYHREGRFHRLFSAALPLGDRVLGLDVPTSFKPLMVNPIIQDQPRQPCALRSTCVKAVGFDGQTSIDLPTTVLNAGGQFTFQSDTSEGALLVTKHKTFRDNAERLGRFKAYIRDNYKSWITFANDNGHGIEVEDLILVTGRDMTEDFSMLAFYQHEKQSKLQFELSASSVVSSSVSAWGRWKCQLPVFENWGPQSCDPDDDTALDSQSTSPIPSYKQCIFIRGFRVKRRMKLIPRVIKASGDPQNLPPPQNDDDPSTEAALDYDIETQSDSESNDGMEFSMGLADSALWQDPCDHVANYIFKNSESELALVHDRDWCSLASLEGLDRSDVSAKLSLEEIPNILDRKLPHILVHKSADSETTGALRYEGYTWDDESATTTSSTNASLETILHERRQIFDMLLQNEVSRLSLSSLTARNLLSAEPFETSDFSKTMRPASIFPIQDLSFELSTLRQEDIDSLQETDPVSLARLLVQLPESFIQELSRDETGHSILIEAIKNCSNSERTYLLQTYLTSFSSAVMNKYGWDCMFAFIKQESTLNDQRLQCVFSDWIVDQILVAPSRDATAFLSSVLQLGPPRNEVAIRAILVRLQDLSSDGALTVLAPCLDMLRNTNRPQYLLLVAEIIRISPTVKETSGAQLILKLFEDLPSSLPLFGSKLKNSDDLLRMFPEDKLQLLQGSTAESVSTSSQRNAARTLGACRRCKTLKARCVYAGISNTCSRCLKGGHQCTDARRNMRRMKRPTWLTGQSSSAEQEHQSNSETEYGTAAESDWSTHSWSDVEVD